MADVKLIFVHGYRSSHRINWYPPIAQQLHELGVEFVVPDFPGDARPHAQDWVEIIDAAVQASTKPVVLIGHSLGTRAVLLYLDQHRLKVAGIVLVAGFANRVENAQRRGGIAYPDFFEYPVNMQLIASLAKQRVVIHSIDDDRIDFEQGQALATDLDARLVALEGCKHMSEPENAPRVLKVLRDTFGF